MNFLENYALSCNLKVDKPTIRDTYYPVLYDNYIVIDTSTVDPLFAYEHWQKVVTLVAEALSKKGIFIIQVGAPDNPSLEHVHRTNGTANYNQISFILKNSKLLVSGNSLSLHIANSLELNTISLARNFASIPFSPYKEKSYKRFVGKNDDNFKGRPVNQINPEDVARAICNFCKVELDFPFETVYIGEKNKDGCEFVETVPDQSVNVQSMGISSIIFRMDLRYNEENLIKQLEISKCTIATNKRINFNILKKFKNNVSEIVYIIEKENDDEEFCRFCINLGIPVILVSDLSQKEINHKKMIYMEIGKILQRKSHFDTKKKISKIANLNQCVYLSNKYTLSNGKIFTSETAWTSQQEAQSKKSVQKIYPQEKMFWKNIETYWILKKSS